MSIAMKEKRPLLSLQEAARELKKSYKTMLRRVHENKIPAQRVGRQYLVNRADLHLETDVDVPEEDVERCLAFFKAVCPWDTEANDIARCLLAKEIHPDAYSVLRERGILQAKWLHDSIYHITIDETQI